MREEKLLNYLKGACTGRKYRASSAELEAVLGISGTDLRKLVIACDVRAFPLGVTDGDTSMPPLLAKSTPRSNSSKPWKTVLRQQGADWSSHWMPSP